MTLLEESTTFMILNLFYHFDIHVNLLSVKLII